MTNNTTANIKPGTTPTIQIKLKKPVDFSQVTYMEFAISQRDKKVVKKLESIELAGNTVSVYLNQRETLWLTKDVPATIDMDWVFADGSRGGIVPLTIPVIDTTFKKVLP